MSLILEKDYMSITKRLKPQIIERYCAQCGKSFLIKENIKKKFCSVHCSMMNRWEKKETYPIIECLVCKIPFKKKRIGNVFCSKSCSSKYTSKENVKKLLITI
jgi:endogenous inhibitor of DNA gyrase (YacG/DUF329 family)